MKNAASSTDSAPKLTAVQFDGLCSAVGWARSSLAGCAGERERARELAHLQAAMAELSGAVLARKNPRLEERRTMMIRSATAQVVRSTTLPVNDQIGVGTKIQFLGDMANEAFGATITGIDGAYFLCAAPDGRQVFKGLLPLALLKTPRWRVVR